MEFESIQVVRLMIVGVGVFLSSTLGIFLMLNKSAKNNANKYLGAVVLIILFFYLPFFFFRLQLIAYFPHVTGLPRIFPFLFGPIIYFYVRACTQKGFQMRPILWLHFIPAFLMFLHCLPEIILSGPEKIANQANFIKTGVVDYPWVWLLKVIHPMIYFALSTKLILLYRKHISNTTSAVDTAFHRWLLFIIFIFSMPIIGLLGFVFGELGPIAMVIMSIGLLIFLTTIYTAALVKPQLFHAFPHQMPIPKSSEEQKQRYERSTLTESKKRIYLEKLIQGMELEKLYLAPDLTLTQVAESINISATHVSQIINEKLNTNFLDFVNGYRIKAAQEKLIDPKLSHYTIISIAYESGFNSKSTFYTAFKKVTGMTPSQYRKKSMLSTRANLNNPPY